MLKSIKDQSNISCGCLKAENTAKINPKNEIKEKYPSFYIAWQNMKKRCNNANTDFYKWYGERGIIYDPKWETFEGFYQDMFETWEEGLTIDRIDVNGNYNKENCRWITMKEQACNRRSNILININGQEKLLSEWSNISGVPFGTIWSRLNNGITGEDLLIKNPRTTTDRQSGVKGIRWSKRDNRWVIDKTINGHKKRFASFKENELDKAKQYFNDYIVTGKYKEELHCIN